MADDDAAWRGRIIDDRYEVDAVLGRGGMGVVLRAHHTFTGAVVAIKVLRQELAQDGELQRRFLGEARASNAIGSPGIVQIFDAGRDAAGELYMVMELLEGESLRAPIVRGALPPAEAQRIGVELATALGAAHAHGFIHRDLKPENVFLVAPTATVKLLDFGIAKVIAAKPSTIGATAAGVLLGTVAYMAPEQLEDARAVDPRSDLWAVGVMIYEMLAGRLPWDAYTPQGLFVAVATAEPVSIRVPLPAAAPAVEAFFLRALARDPARRFASAAELVAALAALPLAGGPSAAVPVAAPVAAPMAAGGSRRGAVWIAVAALVAVAAVVVAYVASRPPAPAAAPPRDAAAVAIAAPPPPPPPHPDAALLPPPDATPLPPDAAPPPPDAAPPPPDAAAPRAPIPITPPPPPPAGEATCAAACTHLATCDLGRADCEAQCAHSAGIHACLTATATSCKQAGRCSLLLDCHAEPAGAGTCAGVLAQRSRCKVADASCRCTGVAGLAPAAAGALASLNACIVSIQGDPARVQTSCHAELLACATQ